MAIKKITHGGELCRAAKQFDRPKEEWLDLSTGINQQPWPVADVPAKLWQCLPAQEDRLLNAAACYYQCLPQHVLAVPGSQWAIATLPTFFQSLSVAVPRWGYAEHANHWQAAGHKLYHYDNAEALLALAEQNLLDIAVLINPNNPTAEFCKIEFIETLAEVLEKSSEKNTGLLMVDEAFLDPLGNECSASQLNRDNIIVLRSIGKFFGLAGLRLGFVIAAPQYLQLLNQALPIWSVSSPAQYLGERCLLDVTWQKNMRDILLQQQQVWQIDLPKQLPQFEWHFNALFATGFANRKNCGALYSQLASQGILIRLWSPDETLIDCFVDSNNRTDTIDAIESRCAVRIAYPSPTDKQRLLTIFNDLP